MFIISLVSDHIYENRRNKKKTIEIKVIKNIQDNIELVACLAH